MGENRKVGTGTVGSGVTVPNQSPLSEDDVAPTHSKRSPAFQFYPAEFLASRKVDRMSMTERGCYITLLCQCWLDNGLPTDLGELAESVRMKRDQFERMWTNGKIAQCFVERGGKLHNERLDVERKKQIEYRRRQADNGSKGGRPTKATGNPPLSDSKALISSDLVSTDLDSSQSVATPRRHAPLITPPAKHANIVFFSQIGVHVPRFLHDDEFRPRLMNADGLNEQQADERLTAWYQATEGRYLNTRIGDKPVDFWRKRFVEWQGTTTQTRASSDPEWLRKVRERKAAGQ